MPAGQKRAPDLITDGCEPPCGCWELNSGPSEEQAMLLTTEPSPQPTIQFLFSSDFLSSLSVMCCTYAVDYTHTQHTYNYTHTNK